MLVMTREYLLKFADYSWKYFSIFMFSANIESLIKKNI